MCVCACVHLKVTGGSNGIGREICLQLASNGCNVAILDVDVVGAERTCHDVRKFGVKAKPYKVSVLLIVDGSADIRMINIRRFSN